MAFSVGYAALPRCADRGECFVCSWFCLGLYICIVLSYGSYVYFPGFVVCLGQMWMSLIRTMNHCINFYWWIERNKLNIVFEQWMNLYGILLFVKLTELMFFYSFHGVKRSSNKNTPVETILLGLFKHHRGQQLQWKLITETADSTATSSTALLLYSHLFKAAIIHTHTSR